MIRRRCRRARERGAVAVETAFVSMLLISILYSIAETSFLLRDGMVVSSASRAGARIASSLPRTPASAPGQGPGRATPWRDADQPHHQGVDLQGRTPRRGPGRPRALLTA